jgi:hypothetical protein
MGNPAMTFHVLSKYSTAELSPSPFEQFLISYYLKYPNNDLIMLYIVIFNFNGLVYISPLFNLCFSALIIKRHLLFSIKHIA